MIDVQSSPDTREVPLDKVGIKGLEYPVQVMDRARGTQSTSARVDLYVNLPKDYKGTHMSRFVEIFHAHREHLGMRDFLSMLEEIRCALQAERAGGYMEFPFFMTRRAPVTGSESIMRYVCAFEGEAFEGGSRFLVKIEVPVMTLCPCSKAISKYGAHNQRGVVTVRLRNTSLFWIEDVIELVESCASGSLYSILKRPDEKYVTEHAYENPRFVEDVVRDVYIALKDFTKCERPFEYFSVECETYESIHNHNAYARAEYTGEA